MIELSLWGGNLALFGGNRGMVCVCVIGVIQVCSSVGTQRAISYFLVVSRNVICVSHSRQFITHVVTTGRGRGNMCYNLSMLVFKTTT